MCIYIYVYIYIYIYLSCSELRALPLQLLVLALHLLQFALHALTEFTGVIPRACVPCGVMFEPGNSRCHVQWENQAREACAKNLVYI